jgi:hypothetical protein
MEESAPLIQKEKDGRIYLEHPHLGFYVRHPGAEFQRSSEIENHLASVLGDLPRIKVYGYRNPDERAMFAILLYKGMDPSKGEFEEMIKGFHKGLSEHAPSAMNVENLVWEKDRKEYTTHLSLSRGVHIRTRFFLKELGPRKIPFVVILLTSTPDPEKLRDIIESFGP